VIATTPHGTIIEEANGGEIRFTVRVSTSLPYSAVQSLRTSLSAALANMNGKAPLQMAILSDSKMTSRASTKDWASYITSCACGEQFQNIRGLSRHLRGPCAHVAETQAVRTEERERGAIYKRVLEGIRIFAGNEEFTTTDILRAFTQAGCSKDQVSNDLIRGHVYWLEEEGELHKKPKTFPYVYRFK
jgi:hypothetical protein